MPDLFWIRNSAIPRFPFRVIVHDYACGRANLGTIDCPVTSEEQSGDTENGNKYLLHARMIPEARANGSIGASCLDGAGAGLDFDKDVDEGERGGRDAGNATRLSDGGRANAS